MEQNVDVRAVFSAVGRAFAGESDVGGAAREVYRAVFHPETPGQVLETAAVLRENGVESALLDFGGNILTIGTKPDGSPWRVGVRDPDSEGNLGVLELNGQGVSVSGGYEKYFIGEDGERYWHILDPATGAPARSGLVQTAIVSDESKRCDALSTALFVMGLDDAIRYWREHQDFEMILLAEDRTIYVTEGLSDTFSLGTGQEGREVQVIRYEA